MLMAAAAVVVAVRRSDQPWARSFRLYAWLAVAVVVIRVAFRIVFGGTPGDVLVDLPTIPLPEWVAGITLLGPVTREGLLAGLYDGLRLGGIILAVGAANALANPKRLLKSVPPALYEIGTALVISVSVLPQLADSVRRVRAAQALRGGESGRVRRLRRTLVPVLEDALERSLSLAAGMDTRGYGRAPGLTQGARWLTGSLLIVGLCGVCVGTYAVLDLTAPRYLATPMLVLGVAAAIGGLAVAGRRVSRSRYRPDRWRWPEIVVAASGVGCGYALWRLGRPGLGSRWPGSADLVVAYPDLAGVPAVTVGALAGVAFALLPALVAPPPRIGLASSDRHLVTGGRP